MWFKVWKMWFGHYLSSPFQWAGSWLNRLIRGGETFTRNLNIPVNVLPYPCNKSKYATRPGNFCLIVSLLLLLCLESFGQSPSHINHQWSARTNQTTERFSTSTSGAPDLAAELPNEALENTPPTLIQPFPDLVIEEDEVGITLDLADYITDQENTLDELIISFEQVTDPRIYPNLQVTDDNNVSFLHHTKRRRRGHWDGWTRAR